MSAVKSLLLGKIYPGLTFLRTKDQYKPNPESLITQPVSTLLSLHPQKQPGAINELISSSQIFPGTQSFTHTGYKSYK